MQVLDAGHGGASGKAQIQSVARQLAFLEHAISLRNDPFIVNKNLSPPLSGMALSSIVIGIAMCLIACAVVVHRSFVTMRPYAYDKA